MVIIVDQSRFFKILLVSNYPGDQSLNGIKTEDLSLNSSRSRRRKDSHGSRFNGRNSSSDESSPQHQRKVINGNNSIHDQVGLKEDRQRPKISGVGDSKKETMSNGMMKKRSDSFVLDINAIMGSINVTSSDEEEEAEERVPVVSSKKDGGRRNQEVRQNGTSWRHNGEVSPTPPVKQLDPPPAPKNKSRSYGTKSPQPSALSGSDRESKVKDSPLPVSTAKPPPSPRRTTARAGQKKPQGTREEQVRGTSQKSSVAAPEPETVVERNVLASPTTSEVVLRRTNARREQEQQKEADLQSVSRSRANALATSQGRAVTECKASDKQEHRRQSDKFDESPLPDSSRYRSRGASSKEDGKVKRSGSFKAQRQMSGDKALGIFYHNRRSQMLDHDSPEDGGDRRPLGDLERSGSFSSPQTPVAQRSTRTSRDSSNTPLSPLLRNTSGVDLRGGAAGGSGTDLAAIPSPSAASGTTRSSPKVPLSPRVPVTGAEDDDSEVHVCSSWCDITCHF